MTRTALISLVLLGCNGGEEPQDTNDPTPTPDVGNDIVDIASGDEQFSTLTSAIVDAGLEDTLRGDGPFTVFAPTDQAFADLGIDLTTLSEDELATILSYHVVSGDVTSDAIPTLADSAADYTLFFDTSDGVMVNNATVTTADIDADNGTIHVVDTVLLPPTILDAAGYAGLSELATAVGAADPAVADLLGSEGDYTVFAPTNDAFAAAAPVTSELDQAGLTGVLQYHVVGARVPSDAIPPLADSLYTNSYGLPVTQLFSTDGGVFVNDAEVVIADIKTTNGIVHVVDTVLVPPTIVDHAVNAGLTGLTDTIGVASGDLGTVLAGEGPYTVFAPTNDAFTDIADVAATLSEDELRDILLFHVVGGPAPVPAGDVQSGEVPSLLDGQSLTLEAGTPIQVEDAEVVIEDIHGVNGTVHVIDTVMLPPSN